MPRSVRAIAVAVGTAVALLALEGRSLQAISPTIMMFYGGTLKKPVFVTGADTSSFGDLFHPASTTVMAMGDRPYLNVALFLGPDADPYAKGIRPLSELTPQMAWQHARFYPATANQPAVILETPLTKSIQPVPASGAAFVWGGPVPEAGLVVLRRLGISVGPAR
jgi:hypothetical protein